jgi:hypothetical protein
MVGWAGRGEHPAHHIVGFYQNTPAASGIGDVIVTEALPVPIVATRRSITW